MYGPFRESETNFRFPLGRLAAVEVGTVSVDERPKLEHRLERSRAMLKFVTETGQEFDGQRHFFNEADAAENGIVPLLTTDQTFIRAHYIGIHIGRHRLQVSLPL